MKANKKLVFAKGLETAITKQVNKKRRKRHKYKLKIWMPWGFVTYCIECGAAKKPRRKKNENPIHLLP